MAWTKDTTHPTRIVYTLTGPDPARPMVNRIIYDPDAPADRRWVWECSYLLHADETGADIERALGL